LTVCPFALQYELRVQAAAADLSGGLSSAPRTPEPIAEIHSARPLRNQVIPKQDTISWWGRGVNAKNTGSRN